MCFLIESVIYFKHRQSGHYLMAAVITNSNWINHEFKSCHIVPAYLTREPAFFFSTSRRHFESFFHTTLALLRFPFTAIVAALSEFIRDSGAFTFTGEKYTPRDLPTFFEEPEPLDIDSEEEDSDAEQ